MVPPSFNHFAPKVPGLQWYRCGGTGLQGKELGLFIVRFRQRGLFEARFSLRAWQSRISLRTLRASKQFVEFAVVSQRAD